MRYLLLIILPVLFISCGGTTYILPEGNLDKGISENQDSINTEGNETGPVKRPPDISFYNYPFTREFTDHSEPNSNINASSSLLLEEFALKYNDRKALEEVTSEIFSISFNSYNSGFTAFIHPPTEEYAKSKDFPIQGYKGGTDLYEISIENNRPVFQALNELNSIFWESHPFALDTVHKGQNVTLLLWSSTRESGYRYSVDLEGNKNKLGNMEIYYAFRKDDEWGEVKKLPEGINLASSNEGTPFIYCFCYNPTLFFSSDRNSESDSDLLYDIYSVKLNIDIDNEEIGIVSGSKVEMLEKGENAINTDFDDRYPFIPNPIKNPAERNLYLSSNRYENEVTISSDTVMKAKGGYDLYKFKLPSKFECTPPPPPKLYVMAHLNEINVRIENDSLVSDTTFDIATNVTMNGREINTNTPHQVKLNSSYKFEKQRIGDDCKEAYCVGESITTPEVIRDDDTLHVYLECFTRQKPERRIEYKKQQGIAFFITGYWKPLTENNYREFKQRSRNNTLEKSRFIDSTDYEYYDEAAKMNSDWFNSFYSELDSILMEMDMCANEQRLIITVHGFTDPIRLRPTPNNEYTKYTSDGDFKFQDFIFAEGTDMKRPNLVTTEGKEVDWKISSQGGNRSLSLLRAHFTKETISRELEKRYSNDPELMERYKNFVEYRTDYFGIYNTRVDGNYVNRGKCPNLDDKIYNPKSLKNLPSENEANNYPHSRRVMIYADVVNNEDIVDGGFARNRCGQVKGKSKIDTTQQEADTTIIVLANESKKKKEEKEMKGPEPTSCTGPCYMVVFAKAMSEENAEMYKNILQSLGFKGVKVKSIENFYAVTSETYDNDKDPKELLERYQDLLETKLKGMFKKMELTAEIQMVNLM